MRLERYQPLRTNKVPFVPCARCARHVSTRTWYHKSADFGAAAINPRSIINQRDVSACAILSPETTISNAIYHASIIRKDEVYS
jgi:hypothetical protein